MTKPATKIELPEPILAMREAYLRWNAAVDKQRRAAWAYQRAEAQAVVDYDENFLGELKKATILLSPAICEARDTWMQAELEAEQALSELEAIRAFVEHPVFPIQRVEYK